MKLKVLLIMLLFCTQALAGLQLRMNIGKAFGDPESLNEALPDGLQLQGLTLFGFDILANPVAFGGFGAGLRFDNYTNNEKKEGNEFSYNAAVLSLLVNYRFINTGLYAGPIVGIGLGHDAEVDSKINSSTKSTYKADNNRSFTIGAEGGAKLGILVLGGELGYLYLKSTGLKDGNGSHLTNLENGNKKNANFSGPYMRLQVGMGF